MIAKPGPEPKIADRVVEARSDLHNRLSLNAAELREVTKMLSSVLEAEREMQTYLE